MNAFADYASQLSLLAGDDPLPALLARDDGLAWRRTYGRFHPLEASYCTLLYEAGADTLPRRVSLYRTVGSAPQGQAVPGLGGAQIALPAHDETLPTLQTVLARHADAAIVRYRPRHRCTFRTSDRQGATRYIKVFSDHGAAGTLHAGMQALWQRRAELGFVVAQPLACDDGLRFAVQGALPGSPLKSELLGPRGLEVAAATGRAAATMPLCGSAGLPAAASDDDTLARSRHYTQTIAALLPEYAERLHARLAHVQRLEQACPPPRRLLIHGAMHPSQWLRCGDGLGLVDFDRLGVGDPELDVATFITELRYEGSSVVPTAQLCSAFTEAYAERVPLDPRRIDLYVAHKEIAKLMRLARAPRPDTPQRFARALVAAVTSALSYVFDFLGLACEVAVIV